MITYKMFWEERGRTVNSARERETRPEIGVLSFPGGLAGKESACNAGDLCLMPGEGNGYPLAWSILAWRILWTEEPGGLQAMGSQRVRHCWATNILWKDQVKKRWNIIPGTIEFKVKEVKSLSAVADSLQPHAL